jgi:hypothetical protein
VGPDLAPHGGGLEAAGGGRRCWQRRPAGRLGIAVPSAAGLPADYQTTAQMMIDGVGQSAAAA